MIPEVFIGPLAGVATSASWVGSSICFTAAGRRNGPTRVNLLRLVIAVVLLAVTHRVFEGSWWPSAPGLGPWLALAASGVLGLAICDQALFTALVAIGPRRVLLIMTASPLFALVIGRMFLDERVGGVALLGVLLIVGGVAWVVSERTPGLEPAPLASRGLWLALLAALLQAVGGMLSKIGMGHGTDPEAVRLAPLAATLVRMVAATVAMAPLIWLGRWRRGAARKPRAADPRGDALTVVGAFVGPYLGVWLSLVAFDRMAIGTAQALLSLSPVMILPFAPRLEGRPITARAVLGAFAAVAGSAALFLSR